MKEKEYYFNGKLKFEGEYYNGQINGKCKEFNDNSRLIFEGEYLNGKRNGKGKEYNDNGELIFKGEFKNGKRWNCIFKGSELKDGKGYVKEYNK